MLRNLKLERSLAVIDTETTGLLRDDPRVVEIAVVRIHPNLSVDALVRRLNPGKPIPPGATAVHGITDEAVAACPSWSDVLAEIEDATVGCDLCGFNLVGFDLPVIELEIGNCGMSPTHDNAPTNLRDRIIIDVMLLFHSYIPVGPYGRPARGTGTLGAAVHRYLGRSHQGAHGALADALAALEVLDAMVPYHSLPATVAELAAELERMRSEGRPLDWSEPTPRQGRPIQARLLEQHPDLGAYGPDGRSL